VVKVITVLPKNETPEAGDCIPKPLGLAIITVVNPESMNAELPIVVTELGIVIDRNAVHPWNALVPIVVNDAFVGSVTDVNEVHP
jgi:hypothetical protein